MDILKAVCKVFPLLLHLRSATITMDQVPTASGNNASVHTLCSVCTCVYLSSNSYTVGLIFSWSGKHVLSSLLPVQLSSASCVQCFIYSTHRSDIARYITIRSCIIIVLAATRIYDVVVACPESAFGFRMCMLSWTLHRHYFKNLILERLLVSEINIDWCGLATICCSVYPRH